MSGCLSFICYLAVIHFSFVRTLNIIHSPSSFISYSCALSIYVLFRYLMWINRRIEENHPFWAANSFNCLPILKKVASWYEWIISWHIGVGGLWTVGWGGTIKIIIPQFPHNYSCCIFPRPDNLLFIISYAWFTHYVYFHPQLTIKTEYPPAGFLKQRILSPEK